MSVLSALFWCAAASSVHGQQRDVLRAGIDSRQSAPAASEGRLFVKRMSLSAGAGLLVAYPLVMASALAETDPGAGAVVVYVLTVAGVTATIRGEENRCTGEGRFGRALVGALIGGGLAATAASAMGNDTSTRSGTPAIVAGTILGLMAPAGAALAVMDCDTPARR